MKNLTLIFLIFMASNSFAQTRDDEYFLRQMCNEMYQLCRFNCSKVIQEELLKGECREIIEQKLQQRRNSCLQAVENCNRSPMPWGTRGSCYDMPCLSEPELWIGYKQDRAL